MCIYYYNLHLCGHYTKDIRRTTFAHCHDFDTALRYWHDQPNYSTLEITKHDQTIPAPLPCPEVWSTAALGLLEPFFQRVARESRILHHHRTFATTTTDRAELNRRSEITLAHAHRQPHLNLPPYPAAYTTHLDARTHHHTHNPYPPPNVLITGTPYGCARTTAPPCLHGHSGPQCPYVLAYRLFPLTTTNTITPESHLLATAPGVGQTALTYHPAVGAAQAQGPRVPVMIPLPPTTREAIYHIGPIPQPAAAGGMVGVRGVIPAAGADAPSDASGSDVAALPLVQVRRGRTNSAGEVEGGRSSPSSSSSSSWLGGGWSRRRRRASL